jgi:hypothetical protein
MSILYHTARVIMLQERNAALRREKELMVRHYAQLKAGLDRGRAAAAERLKQLSIMSGTAMQVCTLTAAGLYRLAASTAEFSSCLSCHVGT